MPGSIPWRYNNPGDLRHSPHSQHYSGDPNGIGEIDTVEHGWEDLERQLKLYAERGMNLGQFVYAYAPPNENNSGGYLKFLLEGFGGEITEETPLTKVLEIPFIESAPLQT